MTSKQSLVLDIVCEHPRGCVSMADIAFEAQTSVQAVGRMVQQLSALDLVSRQRFGSEWEVRATEKGRVTHKARPSEVPVSRKMVARP